MKRFRTPALIFALLLSTSFGISLVDAAETQAQRNADARRYTRALNSQFRRARGAAGREYVRDQQKKKDEAKETKDVQAAKEAQAAKDAQAIKDAQAAKAAQMFNPQSKKIAPVLLKGGLGKDDLDTLDKRAQSLDDLQKSLAKSDPTLSRDELKSLFDAVSLATESLWAARQSTSASQTTIYHLGTSVLIKGEFATRFFSGELTRSDARQIAHDFHQLLADEKDLVTVDSTPDLHTKMQGQYNDLLSKYFESREKPMTTGDASGG